MVRTAVITGGSSGIGRATARAFAQAGYRVFELSRRAVQTPGVEHCPCDITSDEAVQQTIAQILQQAGKIDVLVNNAGCGISGAVEFTDAADAQKQFDVNFFGMVRVCRAVLPSMRQAGGGRIINISSVAAAIPIPFQTYYSASKAAINAYSQALFNEVRPYGVSVCAVMPGDIRTGFTAAREKQQAGDAEYGGRLLRSVGKMERDEQGGMEPAQIARFVVKLAGKRRVKPLYAVRWDYRLFVLLSRLLPVRALSRLVYELYAK